MINKSDVTVGTLIAAATGTGRSDGVSTLSPVERVTSPDTWAVPPAPRYSWNAKSSPKVSKTGTKIRTEAVYTFERAEDSAQTMIGPLPVEFGEFDSNGEWSERRYAYRGEPVRSRIPVTFYARVTLRLQHLLDDPDRATFEPDEVERKSATNYRPTRTSMVLTDAISGTLKAQTEAQRVAQQNRERKARLARERAELRDLLGKGKAAGLFEREPHVSDYSAGVEVSFAFLSSLLRDALGEPADR